VDKVVLDTDILSEVLRAKDPRIVERVTAYKSAFGALTITVISVMEVVKGLHKAGRNDAVQRFLENVKSSDVLAFDQDAARQQGAFMAISKRRGSQLAGPIL
jgi:predicted nucleic acid-binding protein